MTTYATDVLAGGRTMSLSVKGLVGDVANVLPLLLKELSVTLQLSIAIFD